MMNEPESMNEHATRERRTVQLAIALMLLVAIIYAATFLKLPVWLPALK